MNKVFHSFDNKENYFVTRSDIEIILDEIALIDKDFASSTNYCLAYNPIKEYLCSFSDNKKMCILFKNFIEKDNESEIWMFKYISRHVGEIFGGVYTNLKMKTKVKQGEKVPYIHLSRAKKLFSKTILYEIEKSKVIIECVNFLSKQLDSVKSKTEKRFVFDKDDEVGPYHMFYSREGLRHILMTLVNKMSSNHYIDISNAFFDEKELVLEYTIKKPPEISIKLDDGPNKQIHDMIIRKIEEKYNLDYGGRYISRYSDFCYSIKNKLLEIEEIAVLLSNIKEEEEKFAMFKKILTENEVSSEQIELLFTKGCSRFNYVKQEEVLTTYLSSPINCKDFKIIDIFCENHHGLQIEHFTLFLKNFQFIYKNNVMKFLRYYKDLPQNLVDESDLPSGYNPLIPFDDFFDTLSTVAMYQNKQITLKGIKEIIEIHKDHVKGFNTNAYFRNTDLIGLLLQDVHNDPDETKKIIIYLLEKGTRVSHHTDLVKIFERFAINVEEGKRMLSSYLKVGMEPQLKFGLTKLAKIEKNKRGYRNLVCAVCSNKKSSPELLRFLLVNGFSPNSHVEIPDNNWILTEESPLLLVFKDSNLPLLEVLIKHKVNVHVKITGDIRDLAYLCKFNCSGEFLETFLDYYKDRLGEIKKEITFVFKENDKPLLRPDFFESLFKKCKDIVPKFKEDPTAYNNWILEKLNEYINYSHTNIPLDIIKKFLDNLIIDKIEATSKNVMLWSDVILWSCIKEDFKKTNKRDILKYLIDMGFPPGKRTLNRAYQYADLDTIIYLFDNAKDISKVEKNYFKSLFSLGKKLPRIVLDLILRIRCEQIKLDVPFEKVYEEKIRTKLSILDREKIKTLINLLEYNNHGHIHALIPMYRSEIRKKIFAFFLSLKIQFKSLSITRLLPPRFVKIILAVYIADSFYCKKNKEGMEDEVFKKKRTEENTPQIFSTRKRTKFIDKK